MKIVTLSSRVSIRTDLQTVDVDDATVITNGDSGECYGLEMIGKRIWQLLRKPMSVAEVCDILLQEYEIDSESCQREVLEFLNDSDREGIIQVDE